MTCSTCSSKIDKELQKLKYVHNIKYDVANSKATIKGKDLNNEMILETINKLGYKATGE